MVPHNIIVNHVKQSEKSLLCYARIDNYPEMLKCVTVGESITSEPIETNFRNSIGISKWVLIFYPKGQYVQSKFHPLNSFSGNDQVSVYLKLLTCENKDIPLAVNIKFCIKSPYYEMKDNVSPVMYATFLYRTMNKRWMGPCALVSTAKLYSKECQHFFVSDSLTIGCELNVATASPYDTRLPSMNASLDLRASSKRFNDDTELKLGKSAKRAGMSTEQNLLPEESNVHNKKNEENEKYSLDHGVKRIDIKANDSGQTWHQKLVQNNRKFEGKNETVSESKIDCRCHGHGVAQYVEYFEQLSLRK